MRIPVLPPLWNYVQNQRRGRKEDAPIEGIPGKVVDRKKPDSIIHDPRLEELLIETVPTHHGRRTVSLTRIQQQSSTDAGSKEKAAVAPIDEKVIPDNWG